MSEVQKNKTILGPDCRISGELALDNDAVIMGRFNGTLRVSGTLEVTDSAQLKGTLIVGTLRLSGRVEADVVAEEGVELLPGSQLTGQLYTSRLNVVEGAVFQGDVCVGPKAMQAAGEALQQQIDATAPGNHEVEDEGAHDSMMHDESDADQYYEQDEEPAVQHEMAPSIQTVPSSMNAILQRRRPKVLSANTARKSMVAAGNGQH